jgi:hypothetical protein
LREQLGHTWRELATEPFSWPMLDGEDARWAVRSVTDAVVANAYGFSREQYEHVLSTFSHSSYPKAPELCIDGVSSRRSSNNGSINPCRKRGIGSAYA